MRSPARLMERRHRTSKRQSGAPAEKKMGLFSKAQPLATPGESPNLGTSAGQPSAIPTTVIASPPAMAPRVGSAPSAAPGDRQVYLQQLKVKIHQQLVDRLDMQNIRTLPPEIVRGEVRVLIRDLCQSEKGLI